MPKLIVSLAQMPIALGDVKRNLLLMERMTAEAARRGSHLVVFPELWTTGYALERARELADQLDQGAFVQVTSIAKKYNISIIGSMLEKRGLEVANSAAFIIPTGQIRGVYRKIHLFKLMKEDQYLQPGSAPLTLDLPWGRTSIGICYDLRFPELFRRYAVEGTKLAILPAEWPMERLEHWRALLIARAIENQMYVAATNTVGDIGGTTFAGHSMVVDPWGKVMIEAGDEPNLLTAELDLDRVEQVRAKIPVFDDRRPELYEPLDLNL